MINRFGLAERAPAPALYGSSAAAMPTSRASAAVVPAIRASTAAVRTFRASTAAVPTLKGRAKKKWRSSTLVRQFSALGLRRVGDMQWGQTDPPTAWSPTPTCSTTPPLPNQPKPTTQHAHWVTWAPCSAIKLDATTLEGSAILFGSWRLNM